MTGLEELLRRELARTREPDLVVPPGLAAALRRRAHRRRTAVPAAAGLVVLVSGAAAALSARTSPERDRQSVVATAPTSTPTTGSDTCSVPELIAQGGPKSMVEFDWPSGATIVYLRSEGCPIEVMLSSPRLAIEDIEAAERRWGSNIRLLAYDPARASAAQSPAS